MYLLYWINLGYPQMSERWLWRTRKEHSKGKRPQDQSLPLHLAPGHQGCGVPRRSRKQILNLWKGGPARLSASPHHAWWGSEWASEPGRWLWLSGTAAGQCLSLGRKQLLNTLDTIPRFYIEFQWRCPPGPRNQTMRGRVRELGGWNWREALGEQWARFSTIRRTVLLAPSVCLKHRTHHAIPISSTWATPVPLGTDPTVKPQRGLADFSTRSLPSLFPHLWLCGLPSIPLRTHVLSHTALFHAFPDLNFV